MEDRLQPPFAGVDQKANERLRLLWLSCGEEDFLLPANHAYRDWLTEKGLRFTSSQSKPAGSIEPSCAR